MKNSYLNPPALCGLYPPGDGKGIQGLRGRREERMPSWTACLLHVRFMFLAQKLNVAAILSGAGLGQVGKSAAAGMQIAELMRGACTELPVDPSVGLLLTDLA